MSYAGKAVCMECQEWTPKSEAFEVSINGEARFICRTCLSNIIADRLTEQWEGDSNEN